jgi:cell wall-associated NlpC family hydrolase
MPYLSRHVWFLRGLAAIAAVGAALLGSDLTSTSVGDLQGQIAASRSSAASLRSAIAADSARIRATASGLQDARQRLDALQGELDARVAQVRAVQGELLGARDRLVALENRLHLASGALAANLLASYEGDQPDLVTVILEARGFSDLLEQVSFLQRVGRRDAGVVAATRDARTQVAREATQLAALESRDRGLVAEVLARRTQVAALKAALLSQEIAELGARASKATKLQSVRARLRSLNARLRALEARAAAQVRAAAASGNANVGGIALDTGGMVQPPPGAPAAVAEVIAAANAIAGLPYVYGGGHGSFHADGYDCSGSVSYALAAAGLVSAPMVSGAFEAWGDPGPGRWITVYANAGHVWMDVAGWRFDTVAQAGSGTRWAQGGGEFAGFVVRHPPGL